jgi:NADPH-dependent 2,4-dienoyl-CoA reductase/sulfur reductase-like enzyme
MTINTTKCSAAAVAVLLALAGPTALADECDAMTGGVKVLIDKMDPAAGQFRAIDLKQSRELDKRHDAAFQFTQDRAKTPRLGNIPGNI